MILFLDETFNINMEFLIINRRIDEPQAQPKEQRRVRKFVEPKLEKNLIIIPDEPSLIDQKERIHKIVGKYCCIFVKKYKATIFLI